MLNISFINFAFRQRITLYLLCLVAFTLPFGILPNNVAIIAFSAFTLIQLHFWQNLSRVFSQRKIPLVLFFIFYGLHIVGLLWTMNIKEGFFELEKKVSLVLFPILVLLNTSITKQNIRTVLWTFVIACMLEVTICISSSIYICYLTDSYVLANFSRDTLLRLLKGYIHATDMSIYLMFSVFIIGDTLLRLRSKLRPIFVVLLLFIVICFLAVILLLSSRMSLIIISLTLIVTGYYLGTYFWGKLIGVISSMSFVLFIAIVAINVTSINKRFEEIADDYDSLPYGLHHNSTNIRNACFLCSYENILKHPIFGVGTGDVQDNLNKCYRYKNFSDIMFEDIYNAHNQYLQSWMGLGILSFSTLLMIIFYIYYLSFRFKYLLLGLFVFLFSFSCLTESMLGHQKGIVFFAFFSNLLLIGVFKTKRELF